MHMYRVSRSNVVVLVVLLVSLVGASDAFAQSPFEPGGVAVTPAVGFALDSDADVSLVISGALAYPLGESFAVEGELGYLFDLAPDNANLDSSLTTIHGSLLYLINTEYVLRPYVAAGLGIGRLSLEVATPPESFHSTEVGLNLGGGVFYPLRDNMWFRGDVRYFNHIDDVPAAWRFTAGLVLRVGQ